MERSGMWGQRRHRQESPERTTASFIVCIYIALSGLCLKCIHLNPTFRCASCGAEISYPFRIPLVRIGISTQ
ncbi:hypothetical protein Barb4_04124 [Bacteroidales bacterium Barb4]|nr:hypothetical protein Barb4_04124 [Bacteroidales bacterium Barb4]